MSFCGRAFISGSCNSYPRAVLFILTFGLTLLGVTALPAAGRASHQLDEFMKQRGYAAIPLQTDSRYRLCTIGKLHGKEFRMLVATGVEKMLLDSRYTGRFKTLGRAPYKGATPYGNASGDVETVLIDSIDLSGTVLSNVSAMTWDLHKARGTYTGSMIPTEGATDAEDVVLGNDFLALTHAIIDCAGMTLYVRGEAPSPELVKNLEGSFRLSGFNRVKMEPTVHPNVLVSAEVNGHPAFFLVNTASSFTVCEEGEMGHFHMGSSERLAATMDASGAKYALRRAKIKSLKLGDFEMKNLAVGITAMGRVEGVNERLAEKGATPLLGYLGPEVLRQSGALIDFFGRSIYVQAAAIK